MSLLEQIFPNGILQAFVCFKHTEFMHNLRRRLVGGWRYQGPLWSVVVMFYLSVFSNVITSRSITLNCCNELHF
jgi:hypothetical protein